MANVFLRCLIRPFCLTLKDHPPLASHASRSKAEKERRTAELEHRPLHQELRLGRASLKPQAGPIRGPILSMLEHRPLGPCIRN